MIRKRIWLCLIFIIALAIRFTFFPDNVYFGYDQARDSFVSQDLLKGHIKIIGPPSSANENLFHGPLIYYIYAPIYYLSHNNPETISFVFRIINALGLFFVFSIGRTLFNQKVGLLAAFLFAISFEQSQYSLFLSHPALAVITILLYYFGLTLFFFKNDQKGLVFAALGLGLSIQLHFVNLFLFTGFLANLIYFYKSIKTIKIKWIFLALFCFFLSLSTFILAEYKFHFREIKALAELKSNFVFSVMTSISIRSIHDNLLSISQLIPFFILILIFPATKMLLSKPFQKQTVFLIIWFLTGLIPYISGSTSYYHNPGASISLIIFLSFILNFIFNRNLFIGTVAVAAIVLSNLNLILIQNNNGPNKDFVIQPGMLTKDEKKVMDFCYAKAKGKNFSVNGLTIPLYINTTWSYLFEWYGKAKFGFLPVWGGRTAKGYPGHLKVEDARSNLPKDQCLIIEPLNGLSEEDKNNFLREEDYFSKALEQKQFGTITVQYRRKF